MLIVLTIYFLNIVLAQSWIQLGNDIDGNAASDNLGWSVSLSDDGKRVAIGANYNNDNGNNAGQVRIYSEYEGIWTQLGSNILGETAEDLSGSSVSLSSDGKRVAIGAIYNDGNGSKSGHVRIYSESGGVWTQLGSDIDGEAAGDWLGSSVSLSSDGKRVAIGAPENNGNGSKSGHVRIYSESGGVWTQVGSDIDGKTSNYSGSAVSLSSDGKRVAIGAPYSSEVQPVAGKVRVYTESGGVWTQLGSDLDGEGADDHSGSSVSLSSDGKRVAIGAIYSDGTDYDAGHVRIYSESGGVWTQVGSDIDGEATQDRSGFSVSLSNDGKIVAIGAPYNDGTDNWAGHVRIYSESEGVWTQLGSDIDGEAAMDFSGHSVFLSADGKRVAIGAPHNDGAEDGTGQVRVYIEPVLGIADNEIFHSILKELTVLDAYPNPFNPTTTIRYGIDTDSRVTISIYDITGQLITILLKTEQIQGWHFIQWNGTNQLGKIVPNGQYFVNVLAGNREKTQKLMLLK